MKARLFAVLAVALLVAVVSRSPSVIGETAIALTTAVSPFSTRVDVVDGRNVSSLDASATHDEGAPLVLLHGLYSRKEVWLPVGNALSFRRRVAIPDLPHMLEDFSPRRTAELLLRWADERSLDRFHVAGSSFGGAVAVHLADLAPDRVLSVSLLGAPFGIVPPADASLASSSARERLLKVAPRASFLPGALAFLADEPPRPHDDGTWKALVASDASRDLPGVIARLSQKVQLVWCREDAVFPLADLDALNVPHVDVSVANECGHALHVEAPKRARYYLKFFLGQIERGRRWPISYPPAGDPRFDHERPLASIRNTLS